MTRMVEPRLRQLVADELGIDARDLGVDVSLADDLAADSLELVGLALEVESEFGISLPDPVLQGVRTYGDLLAATLASCRRGHEPTPEEAGDVLVWARLVVPGSSANRRIERAGYLTPYEAEVVAADALHAGAGARLELTVPAEASDAQLARLERTFATLRPRGIEVAVARGTTAVSSRVHEVAA